MAEFLDRYGLAATVCTATEYGGCQIPDSKTLDVRSERLDAKEMARLMEAEEISLTIDATHPYAAVVSENIRSACRQTGTEYLRLLRPAEELDGECVAVDSVEEAARWLARTEERALLTTGSKELAAFTSVPGYRERLFARVLPLPSVVAHCAELGFDAGHLIAMQGPFTREMNTAMLRQTGAKILVTKESGKNGGFEEKMTAARDAGARLLVIGRPLEPAQSPEKGIENDISAFGSAVSVTAAGPADAQVLSESEVYAFLAKRYGLAVRQEVIVAGIGMGVPDSMTAQVQAAIRQADVLIGAERMLEAAKGLLGPESRTPCFCAYQPEAIRDFLDAHPEYGRAVLLQSGDTGFFSGAKRLLRLLSGRELRVLPGISSVVYLCARLGTSWEDVCLLSLHGRTANGVDAVRHHRRTFLLSGTKGGAAAFCQELCRFGLGSVTVTVGERLSYPEERIVTGTARELAGQSFEQLCVLLVENPAPAAREAAGLPDEAFVRGQVPMTKREVRAVSLSYLGLEETSVAWDVGAGTGSVSVEMALHAWKGQVYAVEQKEEGIALIRANSEKNGCANLTAVHGKAPEALRELPVPTHVFVGGSGGALEEILLAALEKNPKVRVVINAISLETIAEASRCLEKLPFQPPEIVCLRADRAKTLGRSHLMMGMNPVYIFAATGGGSDA